MSKKYLSVSKLYVLEKSRKSIVRVIFTDCGVALTYSLKAGNKLKERINKTHTSTVACIGCYRVEYLSFLQTSLRPVQSRFQAISKGVDKTEKLPH